MRSIYKGSISFGLVNVPVKLYGATEDHDIKAHQVHAADGGRIRYKRVCQECDQQVEYADIAKSYEYGDQNIVLTAEDIALLPAEQDRRIEVLEFVPADGLDPMMLDKPYFLAPEQGAHKAYKLFATTLMRSGRVGIVQFAMRGKTRLAALRVLPKREILVAHTLRWPDEVREPAFDFDKKPVDLSDAELDVASQLVETMANEFNPDRYRDRYQEELRDLIAAKAEGVELPTAEVGDEAPEDVSDLLAKLEASVQRREA